jgi:hypothetical protein
MSSTLAVDAGTRLLRTARRDGSLGSSSPYLKGAQRVPRLEPLSGPCSTHLGSLGVTLDVDCHGLRLSSVREGQARILTRLSTTS